MLQTASIFRDTQDLYIYVSVKPVDTVLLNVQIKGGHMSGIVDMDTKSAEEVSLSIMFSCVVYFATGVIYF